MYPCRGLTPRGLPCKCTTDAFFCKKHKPPAPLVEFDAKAYWSEIDRQRFVVMDAIGAGYHASIAAYKASHAK